MHTEPEAGTGADREQEQALTGRPASPGTVTAPVALLASEAEVDAVPPASVVVSQTAEPWMGPALRRAAAIVTDRGGMTSHAAVVARELGIPAVVATGRATAALDPGVPVRVDGSDGRVTVLDADGEGSDP